jgi:hypothetical protein
MLNEYGLLGKGTSLAYVLIVFVNCLLILSMLLSCAGHANKPNADVINVNELCWALDSINGQLGCSAQDFIIKSALCEIEIILEKEDKLRLDKEQRDEIDSEYRKFRRSYKLSLAQLALSAVYLNEIFQEDSLALTEASCEIRHSRSLCSKLTKRTVSALINIKKIMNREQRNKLGKILLPASRKIEAKKDYPVLPCGE